MRAVESTVFQITNDIKIIKISKPVAFFAKMQMNAILPLSSQGPWTGRHRGNQ